MARIVFSKGQRRLLEYKLPNGRTLVGRSDACDLVVPGETISRVHCMITAKDGKWFLQDRSRHGTSLNGQLLTGEAPLLDGDVIDLGGFTLRLSTQEVSNSQPTASHQLAAPPAELLVSSDGSLMVERLLVVIDSGPDKGGQFVLESSRSSLGSGDNDIALHDPHLVRDHLTIAVTRGRAILIPGDGATFLDGERVVAPIPVYLGEPVWAGNTVFHLEQDLSADEDCADRFGDMVGVSELSRRTFGILRRIAAHNAPVLLLGESGTGKELAARGLHTEGRRSSGPFVAVNCGAIADTLFESELFGHEKGAFTGADRRRDGAFQQADGGTLFLDEIGELPEPAQAKLLRALESGEVRRIGATGVQYPDVRVVAATNRSLVDEIERGRFRADLYFRLAVLAVRLPPLRERPEDLPALIRALCQQLGPDVMATEDAIDALRSHPFPGNVRELRNVLTRAYVMGGPVITSRSVSFNPWSFDIPLSAAPSGNPLLEHAERALLVDALRRHEGNQSAAARELGIARSTLHYKMRRFNVEG